MDYGGHQKNTSLHAKTENIVCFQYIVKCSQNM